MALPLSPQTAEQIRHKHVVEEERRKIAARERAEMMERERIKRQLALDRMEVSKEEHHASVWETSEPISSVCPTFGSMTGSLSVLLKAT